MLDDLGRARVRSGEPLERVFERQQLVRFSFGEERFDVFERDAFGVAASLRALARSRVVDEHAPHRLRRDGEELRSALCGDAVLSRESKVRFVHQRRGSKRVPRPFVAEPRARELAELVVEQADHAIERGGVALREAAELERQVVGHGGIVAPLERRAKPPDSPGMRTTQLESAALLAGVLAVSPPPAASARTITAAPESSLAAMFAALAPGDTLELADGAYFEEKLVLGAKGTAQAPIVIRSAKGGRAWIGRSAVIEPGEAGGATPESTQAWTPADPDRGIWRLTRPAPPGAHGAFLLDAGAQLLPYASRAAFESMVPGPGGDVGPGLFFSGFTVHVRLRHDPADLLDADGNFALDRALHPDPNRHRILIASGEAPTLAIRGAEHVVLRDLDLAPGGKRTIAVTDNAHHVTIEGCDVLARTIGIAVDESASDVAILGSRIHMDFPPWTYWSDVKGAAKGSTFAPAAEAGWNGFAITGVLRRATIKDNTFDRIFDGIFLQAGSANVLVSGNAFLRGRDDAIDLSPFVDDVEIAHNLIWRCFEGVSLVGGSPARAPGVAPKAGATPEAPLRAGVVDLHHNVIDVSTKHRAEREEDFAVFHTTWSTGIPFARHDCGSECDRARWRFYRNTVIGRDSKNLLPPGLPEAVLARNVFFDTGDALLRTDALCLDNVIWVRGAEPDGAALGLGTVVVDPRFDLEAIAKPDLPEDVLELRARYRPGVSLEIEVTQLLPPDWPGAGKEEVAGAIVR